MVRCCSAHGKNGRQMRSFERRRCQIWNSMRVIRTAWKCRSHKKIFISDSRLQRNGDVMDLLSLSILSMDVISRKHTYGSCETPRPFWSRYGACRTQSEVKDSWHSLASLFRNQRGVILRVDLANFEFSRWLQS